MKVELRDIATIFPYENHPRDNDRAVDAVARSIREFGFRQPIVVDRHGVIVVGHTRWKAAQKLCFKQVPVHVAHDLSDEQARAYRLADNKTGELADWNDEPLSGELVSLQELGFVWVQWALPSGNWPGCSISAARQKWIAEVKSKHERTERDQSDFLAYCNHAGLVVDFHSLRHLFITSLERAGISPRMAQSLARHSDIRLTLQTYTHIELHDQRAAIQSLPGPTQIKDQQSSERPCRRNVAS